MGVLATHAVVLVHLAECGQRRSSKISRCPGEHHVQNQVRFGFFPLLLPVGCSVIAQQDQPEELGQVQWYRKFDDAQAAARQAGKPILLLFQEIPGCETCKTFGCQPLSHPLLVEAMEDLFIPLAIYNNVDGPDAQVLKKYDEPSWNNPVIRYLDANGEDLIPRKDRIWNTGGTAQRMAAALTAAGKSVPEYLRLVIQESSLENAEATFAMHCYWEGEGLLGGLPGVKDTRSEWVGGKEVVRVTYNPKVIGYETLLKSAQQLKCASTVFAHDQNQLRSAKSFASDVQLLSESSGRRDAKASDQKYYLRQTVLRHLPLTPLQSTKINAALHTQGDVAHLLSPRQQKLHERLQEFVQLHPGALDAFSYPDNVNALPAYTARLVDKIEGT